MCGLLRFQGHHRLLAGHLLQDLLDPLKPAQVFTKPRMRVCADIADDPAAKLRVFRQVLVIFLRKPAAADEDHTLHADPLCVAQGRDTMPEDALDTKDAGEKYEEYQQRQARKLLKTHHIQDASQDQHGDMTEENEL